MKKILAAALAATMLATMASVTAFAADDEMLVTNIYLGDTQLSGSGTDFTFTVGTGAVVFDRDFVSDKTINIKLDDSTINSENFKGEDLVNSDYFSFKVKKNEGSKIIKSVAAKEKTVNGTRMPVIEIKLNEDMTDNDYKVDLDFTFTVKQKFIDENLGSTPATKSGEKILGSAKFYVNNDSADLDQDWEAGSTGVMAKPVKNEDNEVTWEDRNKTVAWLTFFGDSSTNKFYPKLSTVWGHQTYATYFNDTDAFTYDFVGNPKISSTSRATLELLNPFINDDGDVEVDSDNIRIYTPGDTATAGTATDELVAALEDGRLVDITDQFTYEENDDGDYVFVTKTRTLGTYIVVDVTDLDSYITDDGDIDIDDVPVEEAPPVKLPPITGNF